MHGHPRGEWSWIKKHEQKKRKTAKAPRRQGKKARKRKRRKRIERSISLLFPQFCFLFSLLLFLALLAPWRFIAVHAGGSRAAVL
jgi:hypothetical protein